MDDDANGKLGFVPQKVGDEVILQFDDMLQDISVVTFFVLKSYGEKWQGSQMTARLQQKTSDTWQDLATEVISGLHGKNTSEMYPEAMTLPQTASRGSSLRLIYTLTGGSTFKLMGLAVCS